MAISIVTERITFDIRRIPPTVFFCSLSSVNPTNPLQKFPSKLQDSTGESFDHLTLQVDKKRVKAILWKQGVAQIFFTRRNGNKSSVVLHHF